MPPAASSSPCSTPKSGKRRRKKTQNNRGEKTNKQTNPGITMATCPILELQTLKFPLPIFPLDQAGMTVGITPC